MNTVRLAGKWQCLVRHWKQIEYKSIYEIASSKLARKTHVDLMNKVQIDKYAAGLHAKGSGAVDRYTGLGIKERFILMCAAFGCNQYEVDNDLSVME